MYLTEYNRDHRGNSEGTMTELENLIEEHEFEKLTQMQY